MESGINIDLAQIRRNFAVLRKLGGKAACAPVLKANAYGMGADGIGETLCRSFDVPEIFVATLEEGEGLRRSLQSHGFHPTVYVLHGLGSGADAFERFARSKLTPVLTSVEEVSAWRAGNGAGGKAALQLNLGLNRLGVNAGEARDIATSGFRPDLLLGHLSSADETDSAVNAAERRCFTDAARLFPGVRKSLGASGGMLLGADYHYDLTRPGIGLYGPFIDHDAGNTGLANALEAYTTIRQIRTIKLGDYVGYNAAFRASRDMRVAVLGLGYADGLMTALGRQEKALYFYASGHTAALPVIGKISMDSVMVEITPLQNELKIGDKLTLLDKDHTLGDLATRLGTCAHEILTSLGNAPRMRKNYMDTP